MVINKTKGINNLFHWHIYKRFLVWYQNSNVQSCDLPVPSLLVLLNDVPLPLPSSHDITE